MPMPRRVTVVVPAYNEAATIAQLVRLVFSVPDQRSHRYDIVLVDDGSTDETASIGKELATQFPVTVVSLARNFGKEAAVLAGLDHATGQAVILMDADLQHPIALFDTFLDYWARGYDSVYAVRSNRDDEPWRKRALTRLFYWLLNLGSDVRIVPNALDFRLLDRSVVDALRSMRESVRFTKGLYAWVGHKSIGIPFTPDRRTDGRSRFALVDLLRLGWDGLTSFSDFPLRLAAIAGAIIAGLSVAYAVYIVFDTVIFGVDLPGWATLTVATAFLSGTQMLFLGIIGEYIRNIYLETKHRPVYVVKQLVTPSASSAQYSGTATATTSDRRTSGQSRAPVATPSQM